jgi:tetratricopeptide (TPR) repeat protein
MPTRAAWRCGVGLLALWLASGCTGPRQPSPPKIASPSGTSRASDAELDRRARALAAYGAGIIREINEDGPGLVDYWTRAVAEDPANAALAREVARRCLSRRDFPKAIDVLEKATRGPRAAPDPGLWSMLGFAYVQAGRTNDAIGAYRQGLGDGPEHLTSYASLGRLLVDGGRVEEAEALLAKASSQQRTNSIFHLDVAELLAQLSIRNPSLRGRLATKALAELDLVEGLQAKEPVVLLRLADQNQALGRTNVAERVLTQMAEAGARNPMAAAKLVEIYLRSGRLDDATRQLEALRKAAPANPMPPYYLGAIALDRRRFDEAAEWLEKSLLLDPTQETAHADLMTALLSSRRFKEAADVLQKGRLRMKPSFRLEFLGSMALGRLKRHAESLDAMARAEKAAEGDPRLIDHRFHFQYAVTLEQAGRSEESLERAQKALAWKPDFAPALNFLGYSWADKGVRLAEARDMIERAVAVEPENSAYLDSLGWVLFRMGKPAEALLHIRKAAEILKDEPDATVLEHLGDVLDALGQAKEARAAWERAEKIESSPTLRRKLGLTAP